MSDKAKVLVVFSGFVIVATLISLGFIFYMFIQPDGTSPDENPNEGEEPEVIENDPNEVIEIPQGQRDMLVYAVIRGDDTVSLYTQGGTVYPIQLEKNSWQEVLWSPNNEYVVARGINDGVNNLYLYEIDSNRGRWITQYNETQTGVTSVVWSGDSTVYFIQGEGSNSWLHEFNVTTSQEILKKVQVQGSVVGASNGVALVRQNETYAVYIEDEGISLITDRIKLGLPITEISLLDSDRLLVKIRNLNDANFYYIYNMSENQVEIIEDNSSFSYVCLRGGRLVGYESQIFTQSVKLSFISLIDGEKETQAVDYSIQPSLISAGSERCHNDGVVLKTQDEALGEITWSYLSDGDINELEFLSTSNFIDVVN